MDLGTLFLLIAFACSIPAAAVLAGYLAQHRTWGPRMRRHGRMLMLLAALMWGAAALLSWQDAQDGAWIEFGATLGAFLCLLAAAILRGPEVPSGS